MLLPFDQLSKTIVAGGRFSRSGWGLIYNSWASAAGENYCKRAVGNTNRGVLLVERVVRRRVAQVRTELGRVFQMGYCPSGCVCVPYDPP